METQERFSRALFVCFSGAFLTVAGAFVGAFGVYGIVVFIRGI
ncbi:hypothetical protein [Zavarzinella formosa]|nr:hypothetical protein [Zavarzinella formosa]